MRSGNLLLGFAGLSMLAVSATGVADNHRPTCKERPELRDCVKVEDPDAEPPKPSVYRTPKPPGAPVARPATGAR